MIKQLIINVKYFFKGIINFFRNIYVFRKSLYNHSPWDYQGYLLFSRDALADMHKFQSNVDYFVSVNRDNTCKHMKRCIGRLDRLIKDEYDFSNCSAVDTLSLRKVADLPTLKMVSKNSASIRKQDLEAVSKFIERNLLNCWH